MDTIIESSYSLPMHKLFVVVVVAALGCQCKAEAPGSTKQQPQAAAQEVAVDPALEQQAQEAAYSRDIDSLCNAEERSGALQQDESTRAIHVAQWLGRTIETQAGRDFLARFSRASADEKGALLSAEAKRLELDACPTAGAWGGGHSRLDAPPPDQQ